MDDSYETSEESFGEWFGGLLGNPFSGGVKGALYSLGALPVFLVCGLLGLEIFPPGRYPTLLLIAPGLVLGAIVAYIYGFIVFNLHGVIAVPLCLLVAAVGYYFVYLFGSELVQSMMRAI